MSIDELPRNPMPWWMKVVIILAALPVLAFPAMLSASAFGSGLAVGYLKFYPLYVLSAAVCAWVVYRQHPALSWILVVLMLLTHAGMWYLVLL